jgi:hypothetical protein
MRRALRITASVTAPLGATEGPGRSSSRSGSLTQWETDPKCPLSAPLGRPSLAPVRNGGAVSATAQNRACPRVGGRTPALDPPGG